MTTVSDIDHQNARTANGFEAWPGARNGQPSPEMEDWIINVLEAGKRIIAREFQMATAFSPDDSRRFAAAVVANLAHHDPPLTIERIR